ncbi:MAG: hypothetical protein HYW47_03265 [Deltaproteobacteria bacterium]|nr:hypothetical protein [Deltaproteobacteria bacterium]
MKYNTNKKSSITLPPQELEVVKKLMKSLKVKSKVEIIRKGLFMLKAQTDRKELKKAFAEAAKITRKELKKEIEELDHLSGEGLD